MTETTLGDILTHYDEAAILKELEDYIRSTYSEHYVAPDAANVQILDLFEDHENEAFCKISAVKYLKRFGKKKGRNMQDLIKAAHFTVMMMHFANKINLTKGTPQA